jgi:hypothetical protein
VELAGPSIGVNPDFGRHRTGDRCARGRVLHHLRRVEVERDVPGLGAAHLFGADNSQVGRRVAQHLQLLGRIDLGGPGSGRRPEPVRLPGRTEVDRVSVRDRLDLTRHAEEPFHGQLADVPGEVVAARPGRRRSLPLGGDVDLHLEPGAACAVGRLRHPFQ